MQSMLNICKTVKAKQLTNFSFVYEKDIEHPQSLKYRHSGMPFTLRVQVNWNLPGLNNKIPAKGMRE
jgi:hypothetical protein